MAYCDFHVWDLGHIVARRLEEMAEAVCSEEEELSEEVEGLEVVEGFLRLENG